MVDGSEDPYGYNDGFGYGFIQEQVACCLFTPSMMMMVMMMMILVTLYLYSIVSISFSAIIYQYCFITTVSYYHFPMLQFSIFRIVLAI